MPGSYLHSLLRLLSSPQSQHLFYCHQPNLEDFFGGVLIARLRDVHVNSITYSDLTLPLYSYRLEFAGIVTVSLPLLHLVITTASIKRCAILSCERLKHYLAHIGFSLSCKLEDVIADVRMYLAWRI
jgi:hypothetical protein